MNPVLQNLAETVAHLRARRQTTDTLIVTIPDHLFDQLASELPDGLTQAPDRKALIWPALDAELEPESAVAMQPVRRKRSSAAGVASVALGRLLRPAGQNMSLTWPRHVRRNRR
jgi:hypothetical protein